MPGHLGRDDIVLPVGDPTKTVDSSFLTKYVRSIAMDGRNSDCGIVLVARVSYGDGVEAWLR